MAIFLERGEDLRQLTQSEQKLIEKAIRYLPQLNRLTSEDRETLIRLLDMSVELRQLGAYERVLQNLSHKCREEEVQELSKGLSKCLLQSQTDQELSTHHHRQMHQRRHPRQLEQHYMAFLKAHRHHPAADAWIRYLLPNISLHPAAKHGQLGSGNQIVAGVGCAPGLVWAQQDSVAAPDVKLTGFPARKRVWSKEKALLGSTRSCAYMPSFRSALPQSHAALRPTIAASARSAPPLPCGVQSAVQKQTTATVHRLRPKSQVVYRKTGNVLQQYKRVSKDPLKPLMLPSVEHEDSGDSSLRWDRLPTPSRSDNPPCLSCLAASPIRSSYTGSHASSGGRSTAPPESVALETNMHTARSSSVDGARSTVTARGAQTPHECVEKSILVISTTTPRP